MKKKRFWLSAALTLVLGVSMLSWAIAAPVLSLVKNTVPEEQRVRMTLSEARASGATLMESILLAAPRTTGSALSIAPTYTYKSRKSSAQNTPMLASPATIAVGQQYAVAGDGIGTPRNMIDVYDAQDWWSQLAYADVFSSTWSDNFVRNTSLDDPAKTDLDLIKLLMPGMGGTYRFTLVNKEAFGIDWWLTITDENEWAIPMEFSLRQDGAYVAGSATTWVGIADLARFVGNLGPASQAVFDLNWRWIFEDLTNLIPRDSSDTNLGYLATKISTMPYYRLLFNILAEAEAGCPCGCGCGPDCRCVEDGVCDMCDCGKEEKHCKWPPILPIPVPIPVVVPVPIVVPVVLPKPCEPGCDCCDDGCCCKDPDSDKPCDCDKCKPVVDPTDPTKPVEKPEKPGPSKPITVDTGDRFQVWPILALMVWSAGMVLLLAKRRTEDEEAA